MGIFMFYFFLTNIVILLENLFFINLIIMHPALQKIINNIVFSFLGEEDQILRPDRNDMRIYY